MVLSPLPNHGSKLLAVSVNLICHHHRLCICSNIQTTLCTTVVIVPDSQFPSPPVFQL